jgi:hypothetical protein
VYHSRNREQNVSLQSMEICRSSIDPPTEKTRIQFSGLLRIEDFDPFRVDVEIVIPFVSGLLFKGVKSKYTDWSRRFVAAPEHKNCADALDVSFLLQAHPKVETTDKVFQKIINLRKFLS